MNSLANAMRRPRTWAEALPVPYDDQTRLRIVAPPESDDRSEFDQAELVRRVLARRAFGLDI